MAVKPKLTTMNASSDDITNAVLNAIDTNGIMPRVADVEQGGVITSKDDNRAIIGQLLSENTDLANAYFRTLLNAVIKVIYTNNSYSNPLKMLKGGFLEAGDIVEEIAYDLAVPHEYDSTPDSAFPKQEKAELLSTIHKVNYEKYYKRTVPRMKLLKAFQTRNGMEELVQFLINSIYDSAEVDEFIMFKYILGRTVLDGNMVVKPISFNEASSEEQKKMSLATVRKTVNDMGFVDTQFNISHMPQITSKDRMLLFMNTNFEASLSVELYAYMFNLSKAELAERTILLNNWTAFENERLKLLFTDENGIISKAFTPFTEEEIELLNSIPLYAVDERFFKIWDYLMEFTEFYNPEKLYWNYWLHTWKIISASRFANAVAFSTDTGEPTGISISPAEVTAYAGDSIRYTATVTASGLCDKSYTLSCSNPNVLISGNALIEIPKTGFAKDDTFTVTATTVNGLTSTSTVTIGG